MSHTPDATNPPTRTLLVVAAPKEADAVRAGFGVKPSQRSNTTWSRETISGACDMITTGVGKAQAAAGTLWAFDPHRHRGVISIGIAGALPQSDLRIGDTLLATHSVFGDEGIATPSGFTPIESVGFPPGCAQGGFGTSGMPCSEAWEEMLARVCDHRGIIATVSTCSGTDARAEAIASQTHAAAENMEGAAVAAALSRVASPPLFAEIRVISNTTGDRDAQQWDLPRALDALQTIAARLAEALR